MILTRTDSGRPSLALLLTYIFLGEALTEILCQDSPLMKSSCDSSWTRGNL